MKPVYQRGYYFSVTIEGDTSTDDVAFHEVSGLSKETTPEDVVCGGENRFKYRLPTVVSFPNLTLKRGLSAANSALIKWCAQTLDQGFSQPIKTQNLIVNLLEQETVPAMSWTIIGAYPVKWSASDLNSENNSIVIESVEVAYQYFKLAKVQTSPT